MSSGKQKNKKHTKEQKIKFHLKDLRKIDPLTDTQDKFFDILDDFPNKSLALLGSAGTGKTFLAIHNALELVLEGSNGYDKLLIIRSAVASRDIGFLPGSEEEKLQVYEQPYSDICDELFQYSRSYENLKLTGRLEFTSSSFLRGTTFNNTVVVVDECQNMTWGELSTIVTRIGEHSKIIFCGDIKQNDLNRKRGDESGFGKFFDILKRMDKFFEVVEFTHEDIVRSELVKAFIIESEKE